MSYAEGSNYQTKREDAGKKLFDAPKWRRYRFYTKSVDDYRPLIFNPKFPWWCSGYQENQAVIIAYLPVGEELKKYWDDASGVEFDEMEEIIFTSRFPKPKYFTP